MKIGPKNDLVIDLVIWDIAIQYEWTKDVIPSHKRCKRRSTKISVTETRKELMGSLSLKKPDADLMVIFGLPNNSVPV